MLIALVNDQRTPASPQLKGLCPGCREPVTARCGQLRTWHWAHVSKKECDSWWEETEWHRHWKSQFPLEWQEVIQFDPQSGEKHIADVRTKYGLVVEFQHSPLDEQERLMREAFYKNMIWIVDLSHLKNAYKRFVKGTSAFVRKSNKVFVAPFPNDCLPANWTQSKKPVFFDFRGITPSDPPEPIREHLWCLLPRGTSSGAMLIAVNRNDLVRELSERSALAKLLLEGQNPVVKPEQHPQPSIPMHHHQIRRHFRF